MSITISRRTAASAIGLVVLLCTTGVPALAELTDRQKGEIKEALTKYEESLKEASEQLIKDFDTAIAQVGKQAKADSTLREKVKSWLEAERRTFTTHGLVPFSPAMRPATLKYLADINQARLQASKVFERVHRQLEKSGDTESAERLVAQKSSTLPRKVVGKWHYNQPRGHIYTLFSDGTAEHHAYPDKPYCAWSIDANDKLTINAKLPGCPPGGWIDKGPVDQDGQTHAPRNNGGFLFVGKRIDP